MKPFDDIRHPYVLLETIEPLSEASLVAIYSVKSLWKIKAFLVWKFLHRLYIDVVSLLKPTCGFTITE